MKKQPHVRITRSMIMTYHGGSCNPKSNRLQRRGPIKLFTRASQRRLCLYADTLENFNPTRLLVFDISDNRQDYPKFIAKEILTYCKKLTKYLVMSGYPAPLFIWRKMYDDCGNCEYIILTNVPNFFSETDISVILNYLWKFGTVYNIPITKKECKTVIRQFCMIKTNPPPSGSSPGKFWGVINRRLYTNSPPVEITTTLLDLLKIEASAISPPENEKFQKNIFIKK